MKKILFILGLAMAGSLAWAQTTQPTTTQPVAKPAPAPAATQPAAAAPATQAQAAPAAQATTAAAPSNTNTVANPQAADIGVNSAQQQLKEVSVDKFEDDGFWTAKMPRDDGFVYLRRFEGGPAEKKPIPDDVKESDKYVLGAKIEYFHRAVTQVEIIPVRPIPIPGITKTISIWVVGRNVDNQLYAIVSDHFGNLAKIYLGSLAFTGWQQLTAAIPPTIRQTDPRYNNREGLTVQELLIELDPAQTYGSYYVYFDDLRATVDLFAENNRDADDMNDGW